MKTLLSTVLIFISLSLGLTLADFVAVSESSGQSSGSPDVTTSSHKLDDLEHELKGLQTTTDRKYRSADHGTSLPVEVTEVPVIEVSTSAMEQEIDDNEENEDDISDVPVRGPLEGNDDVLPLSLSSTSSHIDDVTVKHTSDVTAGLVTPNSNEGFHETAAVGVTANQDGVVPETNNKNKPEEGDQKIKSELQAAVNSGIMKRMTRNGPSSSNANKEMISLMIKLAENPQAWQEVREIIGKYEKESLKERANDSSKNKLAKLRNTTRYRMGLLSPQETSEIENKNVESTRDRKPGKLKNKSKTTSNVGTGHNDITSGHGKHYVSSENKPGYYSSGSGNKNKNYKNKTPEASFIEVSVYNDRNRGTNPPVQGPPRPFISSTRDRMEFAREIPVTYIHNRMEDVVESGIRDNSRMSMGYRVNEDIDRSRAVPKYRLGEDKYRDRVGDAELSPRDQGRPRTIPNTHKYSSTTRKPHHPRTDEMEAQLVALSSMERQLQHRQQKERLRQKIKENERTLQ